MNSPEELACSGLVAVLPVAMRQASVSLKVEVKAEVKAGFMGVERVQPLSALCSVSCPATATI